MKAILAVSEKAKEVEVQQARFPSLGCSNEVERSMPLRSQTRAQKRFCLSLRARSSPTVSSTLTAFVPTTCWMCLTSITSGSITQRSSWRIAITLMASRTFGTRLSDICAATTASQSSTFTYTSRNVSGGSIIDLQRTS